MSKKFLRKIAFCVVSAFTATVLLCGCGGEDTTGDSKDLPELVIGVDYYAPAVYRDDEGNFVGFDIELAEEVCRHIGYTPRFVHIDWDEKQSILLRGEIDCVWCCFTVTGRENDYGWTLPYMKSRQVVAVPQDSDVNEIADLNGKRVAVQSTTKPDDIFSGRAGVKMTVPELKSLNCFQNINYMFAAINEGYVDAVAGHEIVLREYMKSSSVNLRILPEALLEVQIGVAFLPGSNAEIIGKINQTFNLLKNNGYLSDLVSSYGLDPEEYLVDYGKTR